MAFGWAMSLHKGSQAGVDDVVIGFEDGFESQWPRGNCQMFSTGVSSGARDGRRSGDVARHVELGGGVPSGAVEQQDGMGTLGDVAGDFLEPDAALGKLSRQDSTSAMISPAGDALASK